MRTKTRPVAASSMAYAMTEEQPQHQRLQAFSRALIAAQTRSGKSGVEISRELGVAQPTFSDWRSGKVAPTRENVYALEDLLGVEAGSLAAILGYLRPSASSSSVELAINADEALDPELKQTLIEVYRGFKRQSGS